MGARWVRHRKAELRTFEGDGLPTHAATPRLVVLPGTRDEVIAVVRALHRAGCPWVARGAGTGLSGGALASEDSVLVVLTRLNRILHLDPARRRAVVEPGVVNARLSEAVLPFGLFYAPDPSSQSACTLGGNVAENAGGPHCLKYGVTTNHVVALEVLLSDGSLARLGSPQGEAWGPDLTGLFVGSEGMFGIALQITLRLTPLPRGIRTLLADFETVRAASEAVGAIIAAGIVPAALEMMDQECIRAVEASIYAAGYPVDAGAVLLVELDGQPEAVEAESRQVDALLVRAGARGTRSASTPLERARLWQGRKKAFGAMGRIAPDLVVQDAVVPRSALPDVLDQITGIGRKYALTVSNVFHAGDGNLHPLIMYDAVAPGEWERAEAFGAEILELSVALGGSITGEHGVGVEKINQMCVQYGQDELEVFRSVKAAFDPDGLLNPGKAVPSLHR
ncbi:MAG TPA: FAD-linked oxidase C-terminal domain-containing protein, partial [Gemmatimonadales bacterium]|nr:FAD-linked oxidase C-terminal domain-containing protein [Gemmatimonadales bacterium]